MSSQIIETISGTAMPVCGNDIDTDRIIPARFLKCVTFDGLGAHAFEDDRFDPEGNSKNHPMDDTRYQGAKILVANKNFGCGSSREHAPQALKRFGFQAIVAESFAEIFFGNCLALGLSCVRLDEAGTKALQVLVEQSPDTVFTLDLKALTLTSEGSTFTILAPPSLQEQYLKGTWDVTGILMENASGVEKTAKNLPYIHWSA